MYSSMRSIQPEFLSTVFKKRPISNHKGNHGTVCILGGSPGMLGSCILAARAALKLGVGKVLIGLAQEKISLDCDLNQPELMIHNAMYWLMSDIKVNSWVVGCGLAKTDLSMILLDYLIQYREQKNPIVLDAGGLNLLAKGYIKFGMIKKIHNLILTPHLGEASYLLNCNIQDIQFDTRNAILEISKHYNNAWVVLKGPTTLICRPDGLVLYNTTGNVSLATSGTGDVLSGMIGSLIAQGIELEKAIAGAVWLHGSAADLLVNRGIGPIGLTASDLINTAREIRNTYINKLDN